LRAGKHASKNRACRDWNRRPGSQPRTATPAVQAKILRKTLQKPADGQALDRLDPVLPLSPGRAERHGYEYYRHGTLSLYAALDVKTGRVQGKTAPHHASADFIEFLTEVVNRARWAKEIHIVLDNLSAHKIKAVGEFLEQHPKVRFHFTPTYSSWLNQVEVWFAKIQRDVIVRGIFTSVADLARKIRRYIHAYAKSARPFRWTYTDPTRRIGNVIGGTHH
jgi:transposase